MRLVASPRTVTRHDAECELTGSAPGVSGETGSSRRRLEACDDPAIITA